jgi:polysaccharide pyruvyl transferase WcaK-like protein
MVFFAKLLRKKTGMISIGVNEFKTNLGKRLVRYFYGSTDFLTTRDAPSLNILKFIGVNPKKVFETADAAYALVPFDTKIGLDALNLRGIDASKKLVAISVLDEVYQNFDFKEKIANLCDYLIEKYSYTPVFINHEVRVGMDQEATNDTINFMKHKDKIKILSTEFYSPVLMTSMLTHFEFTVGMRMHILILSTIAQIPVVGISRVDKVDNFFEQLNSDAFTHIKNFSKEKLFNSVDKIIQSRDTYVEKSKSFSIQKKRDLERTIKVLGEYIYK